MTNPFVALIVLLAGPTILALLAIWQGLVYSFLWGWFLVPLGAPMITIPLAIGFMLCAKYIVAGNAKKEGAGIGTAITTPLVFLLLGWIVHLFI